MFGRHRYFFLLCFVEMLLFIFVIKNISYAQTSSWPNIDPVTREYYDIQVISYGIKVYENNNKSGLVYWTETHFEVLGSRINNYSRLYGFVQNPKGEYEKNTITFDREPNRAIGIFHSQKSIRLSDDGCIDLYKSSQEIQRDYIATFCYKNSIITETGAVGVYGVHPDFFIDTFYTGQVPTVIQMLSLPFNKYENSKSSKSWQDHSYDGINKYGNREEYVAYDVTSFGWNNDTTYTIQGVTRGLSSKQVYDFCTVAPGLPKKYLRQGSGSYPEGGNLYEITDSISAQCLFKYKAPYLLSMYIGVTMDGGLPYPTIPTTPSPTPTFSLSPTRVLSRVDIAEIKQTFKVGDQEYGFSALAYDDHNQPIWEKVTYEWGISSQSSIGIGTLTRTYSPINSFIPLNPGQGDIYVIARYGNQQQQSGFSVNVLPSSSCRLKGDVNCSGEVDMTDLSLLISQFGRPTNDSLFDMDHSGYVDIADLSALLQHFGERL